MSFPSRVLPMIADTTTSQRQKCVSSFSENHYCLKMWKVRIWSYSVRGGGAWVGCSLVKRIQESKDLSSKSETTIVCKT